jgi:pilus assembly protein Flp/PilA
LAAQPNSGIHKAANSKFRFPESQPTMSMITSKVKNFLVSEDGPTAVEYAVMLAMIVGAMIAAIVYVGSESNEISEDVVQGLDAALNK